MKAQMINETTTKQNIQINKTTKQQQKHNTNRKLHSVNNMIHGKAQYTPGINENKHKGLSCVSA